MERSGMTEAIRSPAVSNVPNYRTLLAPAARASAGAAHPRGCEHHHTVRPLTRRSLNCTLVTWAHLKSTTSTSTRPHPQDAHSHHDPCTSPSVDDRKMLRRLAAASDTPSWLTGSSPPAKLTASHATSVCSHARLRLMITVDSSIDRRKLTAGRRFSAAASLWSKMADGPGTMVRHTSHTLHTPICFLRAS
jgi:hypothetical protein